MSDRWLMFFFLFFLVGIFGSLAYAVVATFSTHTP